MNQIRTTMLLPALQRDRRSYCELLAPHHYAFPVVTIREVEVQPMLLGGGEQYDNKHNGLIPKYVVQQYININIHITSLQLHTLVLLIVPASPLAIKHHHHSPAIHETET